MTPRAAAPFAVVVVTAAAIAAGFHAIGGPGAARERRLDRQRVEDLSAIARAMDDYYRRRGALPPDVPALVSPSAASLSTGDPVTREPYEYERTSGADYRLCARFARADQESGDVEFWRHQAGRQCFAFTATRPR